MKVTIDLPDGEFVFFSEGGGDSTNRLIIQFKDMKKMQDAHEALAKSIAKAKQEYVDYRAAYRAAQGMWDER